jgi:AsmA-like C-terminal region/AsmA family
VKLIIPATKPIFSFVRSSRRIIKYSAITLGLIILVAIIFSRVIFSSDRLTALVLPKISQLLNRDVSAEQVELSFFPTIGIKITGLRVSNPSDMKFDSPYLLDAKSVVIDAKILPLLKNRLVINNVIFYSPTFYIEQNSKRRMNTDRLLNESFYRDRRNVRGSLSSLLLSNFEVVNGNVIWYNNPEGVSTKFLNVDFASRIKTVVEEDKLLFNSQLSVRRFEFWKGNSDVFNGNNIDVSAKLDYDKRHDLVQIESDRASLFGIRLRTSLSLAFYPTTTISAYTVNIDSSASALYNFLPAFLQDVVIERSVEGVLGLDFHLVKRSSGTSMRLFVNLKNFRAGLRSGDSLSVKNLTCRYSVNDDSSAFSLTVPSVTLGQNFASVAFSVNPPNSAKANMAAEIDLRRLARNLNVPDVDRFSGAVRAKYRFEYNSRDNKVNADGLITFADALVQIPIGIDTLYTGECDGSVSLRNNRATFNKLLLRLGGSDLVLSGSLIDYQNAFLGSKTLIPQLRLKAVSRTFSTIGLLPHMNLNIGKPFLSWLPTANISLDFSAGKFLMPQDSLTNLRANLQLLDYFVKLRSMSYASPIGTFTLSGWTDFSQESRTTFSIRTNVTTNNFGRLLHKYAGRDEVVGGIGAGTLTLNGVLDDSGKVDMASLGGRGRLNLSNVTIKNYSVLTKLYSFLGAKGRDSAKFKDAGFTVDITDGRIYFNRLVAYGVPFDFRLDGWHGFDGTLDYKMAMRVYPPLSSEMVSHLDRSYPDLNVGPDNALKLGVVAGGTTNDARFTIVSFNGAIAQERMSIKNSFLAVK